MLYLRCLIQFMQLFSPLPAMTQADLIACFSPAQSIPDRVLLIDPESFPQLIGLSVHECRLFMLVAEGWVTMDTGTQTIRVDAGHFLDILAWEPVSFSAMSNDLQAWCLFPNYLFTNESLNGLKPADSESFKDRHSVPVLELDDGEVGLLKSQFGLIASALADADHFYCTELCRTYFRSFMLESGNLMLRKRNTVEETEGVENRQDTIMRSFLKLVWKYYRTEHNVDFYAARLCLSSKHLSRVVRGKLGKTPHAVIRDELLQRASYLLKDTKISVQDISAELHFSEMAAFCKFFKKHTGMSPTSFRAAGRSEKI